MRQSLSDRGVAALKARAQRYAFPDPELGGHWIRVQPSGAKTYVTVARSPEGGRQVWTTIGPTDSMPIEKARDEARAILQRVRSGLPAVKPKGEAFGAVAANWLARHVDPNGLRSAKEIRRLLDAHVLPAWKDRVFTSIRRSDVAALLDVVEDNHSARQADNVLGVIRSIMFWAAARRDEYVPPIVKGMKRAKAASRARILDDDEIRLIWQASEGAGTFGRLLQMCLLTAQRSRKVAAMKWDDIDDGVWTISSVSPREKQTGGALALPEMALNILRQQPQMATNPHVFPGRGGPGPLRGFGSGKAAIDARLPRDMKSWTIHDLRRSARSLMARANVLSEHAEKVMGHSIRGVEGVYDRHRYTEEKRVALAKLAALIDTIVNPRETVVAMRKASTRAAQPTKGLAE
jgi:integrase